MRARRVPADAKDTSDGRYTLLLDLPPPPNAFSLFPYYLWIALLIGLMSWVFARHLVKPVLAPRRTVRKFGSGNLALRAHFNRHDEIGDTGRDFSAMADRIETWLTAERRLLQDISHEIRTPLSRLTLAVELHRVEEAQGEVRRLTCLIGELSEMARAEGDPASLPRDAVDLTALIRRAVENVLENAERHAPAGTKVELAARRQGGRLTIRIRDHGPGVPTEALEDIFRPFYRVERDRSRHSGGVGLGLAIAQRAIRLHNGRIHAANACPGFEVVITLPA